MTCRDCERISEPPAPFHVTPRGWAGPHFLAMLLFEKFRQHQPPTACPCFGGERAAAMYSLIVTAKLNDIDPQAWLADVLNRIAEHPALRLDELLPSNWQSPNADFNRTALQSLFPRCSPDAYKLTGATSLYILAVPPF